MYGYAGSNLIIASDPSVIFLSNFSCVVECHALLHWFTILLNNTLQKQQDEIKFEILLLQKYGTSFIHNIQCAQKREGGGN